jgi:ATP-dependent exoDNAse (exonuclease V) beta subunit
MSDRSVVVANAGSGKTYLLANRIVRWMLEERRRTGRASPERILAITFTRKAAGEILERVLRHLARGAIDADARAEFADPAQVGPWEAADYAAVLEELVHAMHRMSISTIDGFFVQLAGAFGPELGLPEEWRIGDEDETAAQRMDAVGEVIAADAARATELARRIADGEPKPQVQAAIDGAMKPALEAQSRCALASDPAAPWGALLGDGVRIFPGASLAERGALRDAVRAMRGAPTPPNRQGNPRRFWPAAALRVADAAERGDWFAFVGDSLVHRLCTAGEFDGAPATPEFDAPFQLVLGHALASVEQAIRARLGALGELAALVDGRLREAQRADGILGFADLTDALARAHALGGAVDGERAERLAAMRERLDRSVSDLAFDEFQDTAPAQWAVLEPLVDEIAATGDRRLLVVGDPKQSIYGWRGGTPALLQAVRRREGLDKDVALDTSYRSSPVVLAFADGLFGSLPSAIAAAPLDLPVAGAAAALAHAGLPVPPGAERSPLARALAAWPYAAHRAAPRNACKPGLVRAYRSATDKLDGLAACVASVVAARRAERPGADIAVLVTSNDQVSACVAAIRAAGVEAADEGRSPMADSAAVSTVLALLRIAEHPGDSLSMFVATREPAVALLGLVPMERHGGGAALRKAMGELSSRLRGELAASGLGPWVDRTASLLRPACSRHDVERLRQLSAAAHAAPAAQALRPGQFVQAVMSRRSRAADTARVRVMTVHASKGLEFDEVVLGALGGAMDGVRAGSSAIAVLPADEAGTPAAIGPVASLEIVAHSPLLAAFRAEAEVARLGDAVSSLYVGLTRAREAVHLVCPPPTKDDDPAVTPCWMMRRAVAGFEDAYLAAAGTPQGQPFWTFAGPDLGPLPPSPAPQGAAEAAAAAPAVERVARPTGVRAPSSHESHPGGFFAREFDGTGDGERGSVAHAWLERVGWSDGGAPDAALEADVLRAVTVEIGRPPDAALAAEVRALVARAIAGPMGAVLRADRYAAWACGTPEVRTEMPFAAVVDGTLLRGRMDRVVLGIRDGRVERAEVVDWKTGAGGLQGAALEERIAPYRLQMQAYRGALAAMFGLPAERVTAALAFVDRGEVVEVSGPLRS